MTASSIDCPSHVITVLDEAYCDYASYFAAERGFDYSHALDYVRQERRVVVLRTFSKAHGLAGVRVGYGMGPAELMGYFARLKPAFMVSSLGEAAALAALADADHVQRALETNAAEAKWLIPAIAEMGIRVTPTWTNFLFCRIGDDAGSLCRALQDDGIIVRHMSGSWGAPDAFRVTIGTPEQNQHLLKALKRSRVANSGVASRLARQPALRARASAPSAGFLVDKNIEEFGRKLRTSLVQRFAYHRRVLQNTSAEREAHDIVGLPQAAKDDLRQSQPVPRQPESGSDERSCRLLRPQTKTTGKRCRKIRRWRCVSARDELVVRVESPGFQDAIGKLGVVTRIERTSHSRDSSHADPMSRAFVGDRQIPNLQRAQCDRTRDAHRPSIQFRRAR